MYYQSLNIASPPPGGSGGGLLEAGEKKINLDLRIGRCACASEGGLKRISIIQEEREYLFSRAQFDELRNQISIHNSIAYGFPVAFHLLLPIWMSVFNYLGPAIYHAYPSLRDLSRVKGDCSSSVMDSEPGRCRRTDGRKWRCSKNVVPFQKYCERHMHRGRQGSRKHVEARPDDRAWDNARMPVMSLVASDHDTDSRVSVSIQSDLGPSQPHSSYTTGFPTVLKCRNDETRDASLRANCSMSGVDHADGKYSFDGKPMKLSSRKHNAVGNNYMGFNSPRYGLSPKSVLNAAGKVGLGLGCTATMEAGSQRCRRTDGKKWQCRRDALHNQKYCDTHMHRGAKRIVVRPEYSRRFQAAPTTITGNLDSGINLNMVPASPQHGGPSNNSSSSPSDATTITDENISFCLTNSLHHG